MKANKSRMWERIKFPVMALAFFLPPLLLNQYWQYVVNLVLIYIVIGLSYNLLIGYTGQFSFCHPAFLGIGAYSFGILMLHLRIPFWVAIPISGLITAVFGLITGFPALRISSFYLGMVTLAFNELMVWIFLHWDSMTLGAMGLKIPKPSIGSYILSSDKQIYFIILLITLVCVISIRNIIRSKMGRAFVAIRESEVAGSTLGIQLTGYKLLAFTLSAFYVGIAGSLYAINMGIIIPDLFSLSAVLIYFAIIVIGGMGSFLGTILSAIIISSLPELLRKFGFLQEILYGVLLIIFIIFMPNGIHSVLVKFRLIKREPFYRGRE